MCSIYLAGAIAGKTDEECKAWREQAKQLLPGVKVLDPLRRDYRGVVLDKAGITKLVTDDKADISRSFATIVKADAGASWGTAMEILYAHDQGSLVVAIVGDTFVSPWVVHHADYICRDLAEACAVVRAALQEDRPVTGVSAPDSV